MKYGPHSRGGSDPDKLTNPLAEPVEHTDLQRNRLQASIEALEHKRNELLQCIALLEEMLENRAA